MRERRKRIDHEHHDRWLVSYADFMTLLFAFFVVMYAVSSVNKKKYDDLSDSLGLAFTNKIIKLPIPADTGKPKPVVADKIKPLFSALDIALQPLIKSGKLKLSQTPKGIRIDLYDSLLFPSGSAKISSPSAIQALGIITPILLKIDLPIAVEGHTDNRPINNNAFSSNWQLSAIRATSVLEYLNKNGVADNRLSATGFGASRPVVESQNVLGEPKNRRVSITILKEKLSLN